MYCTQIGAIAPKRKDVYIKTLLGAEGTRTSFIIVGLDPAYSEITRALEYHEIESGLAKTYPSDTPQLATIYEQFSHCAEEMVLQAADIHPAPWEEALLTFLKRIEQQNIHWWLVGSTALAVRGLKVVPHDIDQI